ncbi:MAG: HlyD family efflux transporter periplasmic adaptor subunit [Planctomycetaceae bacterium]
MSHVDSRSIFPQAEYNSLLLRSVYPCLCLVALASMGWGTLGEVNAQDSKDEKEKQVTIEREPLVIKRPDEYQFRFHLEPKRTAELVASTSGKVKQINAKPGEKVVAQFMLMALDDTRQKMKVAIKEANLKFNVISQQAKSEALAAEVLEAQRNLDAAELELAQYELSLTEVLVPFNGKLDQLYQQEGVYVTEGTKVASVVDETELTVQLPLERGSVTQGSNVSIQVESAQVPARVTNISALPAEWDSLRDLASSVAMVTCVIDNSGGKYHAGQTVYSPLIPRNAVAEVSLEAVATSKQGGRQVQVIREQTVRNIQVQTLGQIGTERIFVSGLLLEGDEIVTKSSDELKEGTLVQSVFDAEPVRGSKSPTPQKGGKSSGQQF